MALMLVAAIFVAFSTGLLIGGLLAAAGYADAVSKVRKDAFAAGRLMGLRFSGAGTRMRRAS
jgi:hypothetical protein